MMKLIRLLIITAELILCYILQSSVFLYFPVNGIISDLMMIVVVSSAFLCGSKTGAFVGFTAGLIVDIMGQDAIGFCAAIYMLCGFLCGYLNHIYHRDDNVTPVILTGISELVFLNIYYVFEFLVRGRKEYSFYLTEIMIPRIVFTILTSVVLYKLCQLSVYWTFILESKHKKQSM